MYGDLLGLFNGTLIANFLVLLLGLIASVTVGFLLHYFVFSKKDAPRSPGADKYVKYKNGQHFMPLSIIKITYYSLFVYNIFMGISEMITGGFTGINGFLQYAVIGNVILRILYECVLAIRKNAGLDTDNNTAEEPKVNKTAAKPQYQNYQQTAPAPATQPVPEPAPMAQPVPASVAQPVPEAVPAPVELAKSAPSEAAQEEAAATAFCVHCGKQIKANAKFCPFCGSSRT